MTAITLNISDYNKLKTDLAGLLEKGRQQAQEVLAEVANHTYWKVGRRLQMATDGTVRTESAELFRRLSSDLGLGQSTLYHTLQFFRLYPNGLPRSPSVAKLPWGKQVALLSVPDQAERLRLRGIDTPELNTPAGKKARSFVEGELMQCPFVVIHSYKTDLYARYIADLFYDPTLEDKRAVFEKGHFLNQKLLDAGLALPLPG